MLTLLCAVWSMAWGQSDYSTDYNGNYQLSEVNNGVTQATACKVIIDNTEYSGLKCGTASKAGAFKITVPAGTQYVHLHLAAWKDLNGASLTVTPTGYSADIPLAANSGISNSTPFTFNGEATGDYYKVVDFGNALSEETVLTFTSNASGQRFVVFGVTYEKKSTQSTVATPTFSPGAGTYNEAQSVSINCSTSGAAIYYTLDGSAPTTSSEQYTTPITISRTTTVKAIATKEGYNDSSVASANYTIVLPSTGYDIDFESDASAYTNWTFTNIKSNYTNSGVTAHGGSKYGSTDGKASGSITTNDKIATPHTLTCFVSKQTTNTTSSTWYIQVSEDGETWEDVKSKSATEMSKGEWQEFTADLTSYSDVYVRVYYSGSTAIRLIDDLTLITQAPDKYYVAGDWTDWANSMIEMTRNADGSYTLDNQVVSKNQEFKIIKVASGTTTQEWCGGNADGNYWGINPNSHSDIALNVGGGQNFKMEYAGTWSFTVSFDNLGSPLLTVDGNWLSYYLVGDFNEWATSDSDKFKKDEETGKYTLSETIELGETFKIIQMIGSEETWYGAVSDGDFWVEENKVGIELSLTSPGQNFLMKLSNKNKWNLNFDPDNNKLILSNYASGVAELPFEFDKGRSDIEGEPGLTQNGLDSDYSSSPYLKFKNANTEVVLHFNERPGILTFDLKGNSFSGGEFVVQTSEDGETYTNLKVYNDDNFDNSLHNEVFDELDENVRYIKWIYSEKSTGNVALGNIKLTKYMEPFEFSISERASDGTVCYATISALGEGNWKVSGDVEVSTVIVNSEGKLEYPVKAQADGVIPGDGAYLVKGAAGTYTFNATGKTATITIGDGDNMLLSTGEGNITTAAPNGESNDNYYFYKLSLNGKGKAGSVGFYWGNSDGSAFTYGKAKQAYLAVPKDDALNVQGFSFDGTTGIAEVETAVNGNDGVYTISGMRVDGSNLSKGVYIVNGKKVIIK